MALLQLDKAELSYGTRVLLDSVDLVVEKGQRICLVGRNGAGKSTLMKVLSGDIDLDGGQVRLGHGAKISRLEQDLPEPDDAVVFDVVASGLQGLGELLSEYHHLSSQEGADLNRLGKLQQQIEAQDGWLMQQRVESALARLELPADKPMKSLSGGWRRRVALAKAMVSEPDVLLLDEPTNHLDIASIEWLEQQLLNFNGALIFITHDRALVRKLATHIGELDRGHMQVFTGNYDQFLEFREQQLAEEAKHNALFDKRLAEEEVWIRQGIKARRTRNESRVRALQAMREERSQRRERQGNTKMTLSQGEASGKLVAELTGVDYYYDEKPIIKNFSSLLVRGDRVGLIGPNGAGKSTLLKLILGELKPAEGKVKLGTSLQVAYFDQLRDQLRLNENAVDNIAEGREFIDIDGKSKHVISYLQDFLFTGDRARTPLRALSGGERNRVLLAKLFSKPANLLVLDEPTNDLDVETLELLEEILAGYTGTVLLVSHDREFLDNVVTSTLAFEGKGCVREYVGGYEDWLRQGGKWPEDEQAKAVKEAVKPAAQAVKAEIQNQPNKAPAKKKLSYKLQRELDQLPAKMEALEEEIEQLQGQMEDPEFFSKPSDETSSVLTRLAEAEAELEVCFERWAELEDEG